MGNESYVSSVYRIEAYEGTRMGKGFDDLKGKFNSLKLTEAVDDKNRDEIGEKVGKFFESFSKGYKSVEHMEEIAGDSNKTETQKQFAMNDLDLLGKVVYDSIRDDNKYKRLVGQGSASEIDENLPKEFKGTGKIVLKNVFEEGPVLETLRELDKSRMGLIEMPEGREKKKLKNQIVRKAMEKLVGLNNLTPGQIVDRARSLGYLELEVEGGKTGKVKSEKRGENNEDNTKKGVQVLNKKGQFDNKVPFTAEGFEGMSQLERIPQKFIEGLNELKNDMGSAKDLVSATFVKMSEDPLHFAGWWQRSVANQVIDELASRMGLSEFNLETQKGYQELRDFTYGVQAVLGMQAIDMNADSNTENYSKFAPPKEMATQYHWDNGGKYYRELLEDEEIKKSLMEISDVAFNEEDGWKVVEAFSDKSTFDEQNKFLREIFGDQASDKMMEKGRVAMAIFEVDFVPEWIRWCHESKRYYIENNNYKKFDWLDAFNNTKGMKNSQVAGGATFMYADKMKTTKENSKEKIFKMDFGHPRIMRPWDLAAVKQSYNHRPEILWAMERVLAPFIDIHISEGGRNASGDRLAPTGGADYHIKKLSKDSLLDKYAKCSAFLGELYGGSQGAEFDNLTNLDKLLPLAAAYWGVGVPEKEIQGANNNEQFGNFLADIFTLKTEAMFYPGYKSGAKRTFQNIAALDTFSGEMEKKKALEGAMGVNGNLAHGWVAEVRRLYGIDLFKKDNKTGDSLYPQFVKSYLKVFMDTSDINEAQHFYNKSLNYLKQTRALNIGSTAFGLFNIWTKKK